jgi:hypothetical protein
MQIKACRNSSLNNKVVAMFTRSSLGHLVLSVAILLFGGVTLQAAEVRVNVKGLDGKSANGIDVRLEGGGKGVALSGKTDQKGQYVFKNVGAGTYRVTVLADKPISIQPVQARTQDPIRVEFNLKAIAAGKKPTQSVWARESGSNISGRWVELDANGRLPPGMELPKDTGNYRSDR